MKPMKCCLVSGLNNKLRQFKKTENVQKKLQPENTESWVRNYNCLANNDTKQAFMLLLEN